MQRVPDKINFSDEEEKINNEWKLLNTFRNSLKQSTTKESFIFYDGPPFATGLPHYGHMLAGTVKDIITRFAHQSGRYVSRRFGWDCHGLPVEYEIDKALNITGPDDVAKMGIGNYNKECRKIVMRYSNEWETIMTRLARWIDFEEDYKTMYPWYMESIWFIFREMYTKGLVYRGVKVMPYSTRCNTPLSNFESGQNYKDVVDPQVTIGFPLVNEPEVQLVAWTTTPWTLPSNLCLCVHPDLIYVKVKSLKDNGIYIIMESRLCVLFKTPQQYEIIERYPGAKLKGIRYEPLFPYYEHLKTSGAFQVLVDKYVTDDAGTGIVQQAPYFGEDDYRVCLAAGVISRDQEIICPVDASGCFTEPVKDFLNMHVKEADKHIIQYLKKNMPRRLLDASTIKHSYPFCWRSDTPLIYRAVPSWFVRVENMVDSLLSSSQATYWVPDFVKDKRFGNWLKGARDWAISRNRYWGTPIPIWCSDDGKEIICVGSIAQLELLSNQKINDLHRETVDSITIPSVRKGMPPLRRVSEVFDCWFESGSMPYAQAHFPFSRDIEIAFHRGFPADFISEGIDQTRGWFYTLLVVSTALFNKAPYKNLIASGLVLASDGQKMSKSKKNYPDPMEVVKKYGADALRLYLINSPVVRAENLRFKDEGVRDVLKDVLLPWYNAYRYLVQSCERLVTEEEVKVVLSELDEDDVCNTMDKWIRSATQTLVSTAWREMQRYHLYRVVPLLVSYIDQLTNWYIRMNRTRLKGDTGKDECLAAVRSLFAVLWTFVRLMAPFTPYICELMFKNLKKQLNESAESVHLTALPEPVCSHIDLVIERRVNAMQFVISTGRLLRDKRTVPIKYPLPELIIIHKDYEYLEDIKSMESYILEELNVKKLIISNECEKYHVTLGAQVDHKALGARLKSDFKSVLKAVEELDDVGVQKFVNSGEMVVNGHTLDLKDVFISYRFDDGLIDKEHYEVQGSQEVAIMLGMQQNSAMLDEGLAREVVNLVQKLRKKAQLVPTDPIVVFYDVLPADSDLSTVVKQQLTYIQSLLRAPMLPLSSRPLAAASLISENCQLKGTKGTVVLDIVASPIEGSRDVLDISKSSPKTKEQHTRYEQHEHATFPESGYGSLTPCVSFAVVYPLQLQTKKNPHQGLIIPVENPIGSKIKTYLDVIEIAASHFEIPKESFILVDQNGKSVEASQCAVKGTNGAIFYATSQGQQVCHAAANSLPLPLLPNQPFANISYKGTKTGLVFLVDNKGKLRSAAEVVANIRQLYNIKCDIVVSRGQGINHLVVF